MLQSVHISPDTPVYFSFKATAPSKPPDDAPHGQDDRRRLKVSRGTLLWTGAENVLL